MKIGDKVYVSSNLIGEINYPYAVIATEIVSVSEKEASVMLRDGSISKLISKEVIFLETGVLIVTIGDLNTETALLKPLSKSLLQFCRLLFPDDSVLSLDCRTTEEFSEIMKRFGAAYQYIILVGHGQVDGVCFLNGAVEWGSEVAEYIEDGLLERIKSGGTKPKHVISLCCETGKSEFSKSFSKSLVCKSIIAPFHKVNGAVASQFVQTYLLHLALQGKKPEDAYKLANASIPDKTSFRLWIDGRIS